jgi:hypothetical protein
MDVKAGENTRLSQNNAEAYPGSRVLASGKMEAIGDAKRASWRLSNKTKLQLLPIRITGHWERRYPER